MARLRRQPIDGDEDREDSDFVQTRTEQRRLESMLMLGTLQKTSRTSPRKTAVKSYGDDCGDSEAECRQSSIILQPKTTPKKTGTSRQIRLVPLQGVLASTALKPSLRPEAIPSVKLDSPRKPKKVPLQTASAKLPQADVAESSDSMPEVDAEESIWCGSNDSEDDSEDELPSPRKFLSIPRKTGLETLSGWSSSSELLNDSLTQFKKLSLFDSDPSIVETKTKPDINSKPSSRPASSSDKENQSAFLRFSPPRLFKPQKPLSKERPVTPPQSPSKSRLQSPSKTKSRIPTPPYRQSLDAFWDADTANDWNEQYSPKKILKSPRKLKFLQSDSQQSRTSSPRKIQSPFKKTKAELEVKKVFTASKHRIAEEFLAELDSVVTDGKVRELAAATGGVHFIWSKTLNSTAGRANWRRETTKTRHLDGTSKTAHKHHASIELAEKVIDDEDRLLNVIAHEFCHLANFMVSGIKDQPHGRQFKEWGRKCSAAFGHRGVKVTTKHSFEIEYKYIWQCSNEDCGVEFKRHSKSIDPMRHTCGSCRSKLVQIKPIPRKTGEAGGSGTGYSAYVKANFAIVKRSMAGASQKEVMEAVARKYRAEKEAKASLRLANDLENTTEADEVAKALEVITIEDD